LRPTHGALTRFLNICGTEKKFRSLRSARVSPNLPARRRRMVDPSL
jgi:hypothetical protein